MRNGSAKHLIFGTIFAVCCPLLSAALPSQAQASQTTSHAASKRAPTAHLAQARSSKTAIRPTASHSQHGRAVHGRQVARASKGGGISCVPYARNVSGIRVAGNAWQWWDNAEGVYARGRVPEPGSVLAFRANGRMSLGHVAVVSRVINAREIEINHANWASRGGVSRGVPVVDVSEANNWSAVRVGLAHNSGDFGSVYPTYGFIYDRPDNGVMVAHNARPAPTPQLNPIPSDLRPVAERPWRTYEEVAEAPGPRVTRTSSGRVAGVVGAGQ
ncbi:MAG: CHAP domain-containing protein [Rhodospirillales bacterium]|nr:CHAP domain-containing protein [Rhodospirillales bacterium]MBN8909432.1 CHAP domain-containing protein [Rhodospirillales bacterium]